MKDEYCIAWLTGQIILYCIACCLLPLFSLELKNCMYSPLPSRTAATQHFLSTYSHPFVSTSAHHYLRTFHAFQTLQLCLIMFYLLTTWNLLHGEYQDTFNTKLNWPILSWLFLFVFWEGFFFFRFHLHVKKKIDLGIDFINMELKNGLGPIPFILHP